MGNLTQHLIITLIHIQSLQYNYTFIIYILMMLSI